MDITFAELGLNEQILNGVNSLGYTTPTPVQQEAIPAVLDGRDVVALAQTGTGKTAAFALPSLQLTQDKKVNKRNRGPFVLVISPTRELAQQAGRMVNSINHETHQKCTIVTGGSKFGPQVNACQRGEHMLVATPGRLQDLINRNVVHLNEVEILVLDEADRMLDMGFWKDIEKIIELLPEEHQTLLFSATMPASIQSTVDKMLNNPVTVEIARSGDTAKNVEQFLCPVVQSQKKDLLLDLLKQEKPKRALVFCRTKRRVNDVSDFLRDNRFRSEPMHSDRTQRQRERALDKFRKANLEVLVATDVLARGIDVSNIDLVINFDAPLDPEDYVHRIGRTGRADAKGKAFTFMAPQERNEIQSIEFFTDNVIDNYDLAGFEYDFKRIVLDEERIPTKPGNKRGRGGNGRGRGRGGNRGRNFSGNRRGGNSGRRPGNSGSGRPNSRRREDGNNRSENSDRSNSVMPNDKPKSNGSRRPKRNTGNDSSYRNFRSSKSSNGEGRKSKGRPNKNSGRKRPGQGSGRPNKSNRRSNNR